MSRRRKKLLVQRSPSRGLLNLCLLGLLTHAHASDATAPEVPPDPNAPRLSPDNIRLFDRYGYFSPEFKSEIKRLVEVRQGIATARAERNQLQDSLPEKEALAKAATAKAAALRKQWDGYTGQEERLYAELQNQISSNSSPLAEHLAAVQGYLWSYPNSPHLADLQQMLQQIQTQIAAQALAEKNAELARQAARAALMERMHARQLSLAEWNSFLSNLSQNEVVTYLGQPSIVGTDYWIYTGGWVVDPITQKAANLQVSFNGTRVLTVTTSPIEQ